jgi:O-antigen/teichoic acid export membrane protein
MTDAVVPDAERSSPLARLFTAYAGLQVLLALASLVRNKVTAINLGPAGYGEFAQLMNVNALLVAGASLGLGVALGRNLAVTDDRAIRRATLGTALTVTTVVSSVVSLITLATVLGGMFLPLAALPSGPVTTAAAVVAVVAVPITCIQGVYIAALQGLLDAKGMARSRGVAVAAATVLAIPLIVIWGLVGAVASALLIALFTSVALAARLRTLGYSPLSLTWSTPAMKALLALGLTSTASAVAHAGADVVSRGITLASVGTKANGLIQAPVSVTALLQGVLLGSIGAISIAVVARASGPAQMRQELQRMLDFLVPFAVLGFAALGALAPLVLRLLFSNAFAEAHALFLPVLLYQFTVVLYWIFGSPLLAAGRVGLWLALELIGAAAKVALAWWLVPMLGMEGLPLSLLLFALLHLALNIVGLRRALGITIAASRYAAVTLGATAIAACWWLPPLGLLGMGAATVILAATLAVCLRTFRLHR